LRTTLQHHGTQVIDVSEMPLPESARALIRQSPNIFFTRDSAICLPQGGIILRMATKERMHEPTVMESVYRVLDIPILARIPEGIAVEGGDIIFAKEDALFMGYGPRTSLAGVEYVRDFLMAHSEGIREIVAFRISHERINLDGVLMPLSPSLVLADMSALDSTAILYRKGGKTSIDVRTYMRKRGFDLLEISRSEGFMLSTNLVHLGENKVVAYQHNQRTNDQLERMGFTVLRIPGDELVKGSGGPRCMTNVIRYPVPNASWRFPGTSMSKPLSSLS
jgi:N-dimethylarginine dimethylaminohydrolase